MGKTRCSMFDVSLYSYEQLFKIFETAVLNMRYANGIIEIKRDSIFNRRISRENFKIFLQMINSISLSCIFCMKWGDTDQLSKSKVQRKNRKQEQTRTSTKKIEVGSGVIEE